MQEINMKFRKTMIGSSKILIELAKENECREEWFQEYFGASERRNIISNVT